MAGAGTRRRLHDDSGLNGPLGVLSCSSASLFGLGDTGHRLGIISGRVGKVSGRGLIGGGDLGILSSGDCGKLRPVEPSGQDLAVNGTMLTSSSPTRVLRTPISWPDV